MEPSAPGSFSLLGSLRNLADGLLGSAHDRLELIAVELQEEKFRLIQLLLWIAAVVTLGLLAIVFASLALVVAFWETARVAVVCGLAAFYLAGLVAAIARLRGILKNQPKPFAGSIAALREDRGCIPGDS